MRSYCRLVSDSRGGGFVEYIVLVALVALAGIGAYAAFGESVGNKIKALGAEVSGIGASSKGNVTPI